MGTRVIDIYKIEYPDYNVIQFKGLISHDDFINDIKPTYNRIADIEKQQPLSKTSKAKISELKRELKEKYGEHYMTDESPLWLSQFNDGIMDSLPWQGGKIKVKLTKQ